MYCVSTNLRVPDKELFDFLWPKAPRNFPSLPLDSVVGYRVYPFLEGGTEMEILSIGQVARTPSRGRRGNGAVLRARGLAGGTAAPGLGLSAVLPGGGHASPLY